jgi:hypothetical protein
MLHNQPELAEQPRFPDVELVFQRVASAFVLFRNRFAGIIPKVSTFETNHAPARDFLVGLPPPNDKKEGLSPGKFQTAVTGSLFSG